MTTCYCCGKRIYKWWFYYHILDNKHMHYACARAYLVGYNAALDFAIAAIDMSENERKEEISRHKQDLHDLILKTRKKYFPA